MHTLKIMSRVLIKRCRAENKRSKRKIDGFRKRLMIAKSEFSECPEHEIKSKIGNILVNKKYTWRVFC